MIWQRLSCFFGLCRPAKIVCDGPAELPKKNLPGRIYVFLTVMECYRCHRQVEVLWEHQRIMDWRRLNS